MRTSPSSEARPRHLAGVPGDRREPLAVRQGHGSDVAECDYRPGGWPVDTRCVVRRVRVDHDELKSDPRSRRRRTIDPNELALLEADELGFGYAYSFICTNLDWEVT